MKSLERKTSRFLDIIFCCLFMPLLIVSGPAHHWIADWPIFFIIDCAFLYGCYFCLKHVNLPGLFLSGDYRRLAVIMAVLILCNYAISFYPLPEMDFIIPSMTKYQTSVRNYSISLSLWLMLFAVLCYSLTISFITELYRQTLLRKEMENQRDKAELAVFKAQISPHFLFNTLNTLYSLVIGTSQKAEDAFIKFTDILKYTYVTIGNETVPLRDEIAYIGNYIDLQKLRLNNHTRIIWTTDIGDDSIMVPPMIFLTFVENAFKYGTSSSRDCCVEISIRQSLDTIEFKTRNSIMKHPSEFRTEVPVGINNCRARLDSLYSDNYRLSTEEKDGIFYVDLIIYLNNNHI